MAEKVTLNELLAVDLRDPGCDAGFEVMAEYVDLNLAGEDPAVRFPGVAAHLRSCPGCQIDYEGILEAARTEA